MGSNYRRGTIEHTQRKSSGQQWRNGPSQASVSRDFEGFVYLLSHDVRNSVRALVELPQWIHDDLTADGYKIDGPLAEHFDLMETHTRRLDRMLIDLLFYSRVGRKQSVRSIDLEDTLNLVIDQLSLPKDFEITFDLKRQNFTRGEQDIFMLFSALLSKAVKHHCEGPGKICVSSYQDQKECVISVEDDGPGIPEKYHDRVFETMTTLRPRDDVEGSGMGLAIARKAIEFYGGRLAWIKPTNGYNTALEMRFSIV